MKRSTLLLLFFFFLHCSVMNGRSSLLEKEMEERISSEKVRDVDGNEYGIVEIAGLRWMAENLRTTRYCNGDTIAHASMGGRVAFGGVRPWNDRNEGAWCYFGDNTGARDIHREKADINAYYGKLYNWYAVNDERNVCPCGWHPATVEEWNRLDAVNGGGRNTAVAIKSNHDGFWKFPDGTETGKSGFEALPGGYRQHDGNFDGFGTMAYWWTADEHEKLRSEAPYRMLWAETGERNTFRTGGTMPKGFGASIRCIEDHKGQAVPKRSGVMHKPTTTVVRDIDGNSYNTVIIGSVEWMMSDLRTTRFSNGDPIPHIPDQELWEAQEEPAWSTPLTPETKFRVRKEDWTSAQISAVLPFISKDWGHFSGSFFTPDDDAPDHAMPLWEAMEAQWSVPPEGIHLYNGYAVLDERGLCPTGWRVGPMKDLVDMYGGNMDAGKALINEVDGFLTVFAGGRSNGFSLPGFSATYWTRAPEWGGRPLDYVSFNAAGGEVFLSNTSLAQGKSVRCVRGTSKR